MLSNTIPVKTFLKFRALHYLKPTRFAFKIKSNIMKQYLVVGLIMLAVFLPVRLVFYNYVSHSVWGNLGVMSAIAIVMFILIEKNKLGWFGRYFKNRVRRLVFHRIVWLVIFINVSTILMYGYFLVQIDKVESEQYKEEIDFFMALLIVNQTDGTLLPDSHDLKEMGLYPSEQSLNNFINGLEDNSTQDRIIATVSSDEGVWHLVDLMLAVTIYEMNQDTGAWGSHFITVIIVEELEALALLFFYRKVYFKKGGASWQSLGFPKKTKQFVRWYNKPPKQKQEVY